MNTSNTKSERFDIKKLKGRLSEIRDWMTVHRFPPKFIFYFLGIASTVWFLMRVIPKPSRASYACMRVAAPFMSSFILYLLSIGGTVVALRKAKHHMYKARYLVMVVFIVLALTGTFFSLINGSSPLSALVSSSVVAQDPDDGPNQPMGVPVGVVPGRVVWAWDPAATDENTEGYWFAPDNTNQAVVSKMFDESILKLTDETSIAKSWDMLFKDFNGRKHNERRGYRQGEKIFIKINQTSGRGRLTPAMREQGNYSHPANSQGLGTCETGPHIILQILRQLINECGVAQSDIAIADPQNPTYAHNVDPWRAEFPDIVIPDRSLGTHGRTLIKPTEKTLLYYSDKRFTDKLYDIIENADYMINVMDMKPHSRAGITLNAKNHFGSHSREGAYHLHYSLVSPVTGFRPTNVGYKKYRVFVDLMGSKYLGQNTLLFVLDALYAGGASEGGPPVKYYMAPFNGDWANSILVSQDQVAIESVGYDFLRAEWNGTYAHDPSNNGSEVMPSVYGVDDYLHQAALPANWPEGIVYDPDNSGKPLASLGVHEHWNNPVNKQYSRNLGRPSGIELVAIPEHLVGPNAPQMVAQTNAPAASAQQAGAPARPRSASEAVTLALASTTPQITSVVQRPLDDPKATHFYGAVVDDNNGKFYLTDLGITGGRSFNTVYENPKIPTRHLKNMVYVLSSDGPMLWMTSDVGAIAALLPITAGSDVKVFDVANSPLQSNHVISIAKGGISDLYWFGTEKGVSAIYKNTWIKPVRNTTIPDELFDRFPITTMDAERDTLYVGTEGGGVLRFFKDNAGEISFASKYVSSIPGAMPSDSVYSICVAKNGTQWIGTSQGVGKHEGYEATEKWTVFNTENGLVNNSVRVITEDPWGNIWCGTQGGISVYDGTGWRSFTTENGLISNNITFITIDTNGMVYIGADNGLMTFSPNNGQLICYQ